MPTDQDLLQNLIHQERTPWYDHDHPQDVLARDVWAVDSQKGLKAQFREALEGGRRAKALGRIRLTDEELGYLRPSHLEQLLTSSGNPPGHEVKAISDLTAKETEDRIKAMSSLNWDLTEVGVGPVLATVEDEHLDNQILEYDASLTKKTEKERLRVVREAVVDGRSLALLHKTLPKTFDRTMSEFRQHIAEMSEDTRKKPKERKLTPAAQRTLPTDLDVAKYKVARSIIPITEDRGSFLTEIVGVIGNTLTQMDDEGYRTYRISQAQCTPDHTARWSVKEAIEALEQSIQSARSRMSMTEEEVHEVSRSLEAGMKKARGGLLVPKHGALSRARSDKHAALFDNLTADLQYNADDDVSRKIVQSIVEEISKRISDAQTQYDEVINEMRRTLGLSGNATLQDMKKEVARTYRGEARVIKEETLEGLLEYLPKIPDRAWEGLGKVARTIDSDVKSRLSAMAETDRNAEGSEEVSSLHKAVSDYHIVLDRREEVPGTEDCASYDSNVCTLDARKEFKAQVETIIQHIPYAPTTSNDHRSLLQYTMEDIVARGKSIDAEVSRYEAELLKSTGKKDRESAMDDERMAITETPKDKKDEAWKQRKTRNGEYRHARFEHTERAADWKNRILSKIKSKGDELSSVGTDDVNEAAMRSKLCGQTKLDYATVTATSEDRVEGATRQVKWNSEEKKDRKDIMKGMEAASTVLNHGGYAKVHTWDDFQRRKKELEISRASAGPSQSIQSIAETESKVGDADDGKYSVGLESATSLPGVVDDRSGDSQGSETGTVTLRPEAASSGATASTLEAGVSSGGTKSDVQSGGSTTNPEKPTWAQIAAKRTR